QVLDRIDESLVAEVGTEASHNLTAHSLVILPGMEPLDILHLGETLFTDLFHHSLVRIFPLFLESLCCFQGLFPESFDAGRQTELWAATIVAHGPENVQHGRGSWRREPMHSSIELDASPRGPFDCSRFLGVLYGNLVEALSFARYLCRTYDGKRCKGNECRVYGLGEQICDC